MRCTLTQEESPRCITKMQAAQPEACKTMLQEVCRTAQSQRLAVDTSPHPQLITTETDDINWANCAMTQSTEPMELISPAAVRLLGQTWAAAKMGKRGKQDHSSARAWREHLEKIARRYDRPLLFGSINS
eukprot:CAMPEP_0119334384 /NCGR_PEP_ID=MMETSP1333-20130426/87243_1 /TAXON_ID=418940 /ORGANISM="Scyphosphaera apsteinii, Strain RCC1455" /LENGTH=129 /DNA_ID=CAMNT_0007344671 /DNA_START=232 /DNA_END=621 /DNA_ORIENTATION=+